MLGIAIACFRHPPAFLLNHCISNSVLGTTNRSSSGGLTNTQCHRLALASCVSPLPVLQNRGGKGEHVRGWEKKDHASSCVLASARPRRHSSIWHALLPSTAFHSPPPPPIDSMRWNLRMRSVSGMETDGSWNASWDARPARWLHGIHSAWLLFGVCSCFYGNTNAAHADDLRTSADPPPPPPPCHGKKIHNHYSVTAIPADGRCLFRAVAHGACLKTGKQTPSENLQREMADALRAKVADEFIKRREETEWFLEGNFEEYVEQIKKTHVWGGEPELLMASHVLRMPITVYMRERSTSGLIAIAEYGQNYGKKDPICILYDGFGHYEALQIDDDSVLQE